MLVLFLFELNRIQNYFNQIIKIEYGIFKILSDI